MTGVSRSSLQVGLPAAEVDDVDRCPSCGASTTPEVAWCTLCYSRFDVPAASRPVPVPTVPGGVPGTAAVAVAPEAAGGPVSSEATWPCSTCGGAVPLADTACACGTPFLAGAAVRSALPLPGVGDLAALSRGRRLGVAAVAALVGALLVLVLLTVLGAAL